MIGRRYWSTGIKVIYSPGNVGGPVSNRGLREWGAKLDFFDDGFCQTESTEGELRTRYFVGTLTEAVELLRRDAERLGIEWKSPTLYVPGDGEDDDPLPDNWRELIDAECSRMGWRSVYAELEGARE